MASMEPIKWRANNLYMEIYQIRRIISSDLNDMIYNKLVIDIIDQLHYDLGLPLDEQQSHML